MNVASRAAVRRTVPSFMSAAGKPSAVLLGCFAQQITRDFWIGPQTVTEPQEHLVAAIQWLKRSHDQSPDQGVSWGYSLKGGWRPSYRETSGYIAVTLFNLAHQLQDREAEERAVAIAHWLVNQQNPDGSISDPRYGSSGIVFDTGQVLFGYTRAYKETQNPEFLAAAERAANWLVQVADAEGRWTRHTHLGIPHVYNTRVAWALLQMNALRPKSERLQVAKANLDWALTQQNDWGWFEQCAFTSNTAPFTHTIAYAIRGLLQSGWLLNEPKYTQAAVKAAEAMLDYVREDGLIPGQIATDGTPQGRYCCLTGNCQMAIIWLKLYEETCDRRYYQAATKSLRYVMSSQNLRTQNPNIYGGIKGSQPIWGSYTRLSYPNWATKFFIDALLLWVQLQP